MAGVTLEHTRTVGIITFGYVLLLSSSFERVTTSCSLTLRPPACDSYVLESIWISSSAQCGQAECVLQRGRMTAGEGRVRFLEWAFVKAATAVCGDVGMSCLGLRTRLLMCCLMLVRGTS